MAVDVTRSQVLSYRVAMHQLERGDSPVRDLKILDLGVQDTPYGSARLAVAARTTMPFDQSGLRLVWAARGAPHLHRKAELPALNAALWPLSEADATARIATTSIKEGAKLGFAAFTATATAMREVVTSAMPKGEVSAAVSARVPASLTYWCPPCQAQHISGQLFQLVGLAGGLWIDTTDGKTTLAPISGWGGLPSAAAGTGELALSYLRLPRASDRRRGGELYRYRPVSTRDVLAYRPGDGREAWLPEGQVPALLAAPTPRLVRLLPPSDPFLQARDRELLLPDRERRRTLWRATGAPGAVLVDAEITGTWRGRATGKKRLDVSVTWFEPQPTTIRAEVAVEAERVAAVRALPDVRVSYLDE